MEGEGTRAAGLKKMAAERGSEGESAAERASKRVLATDEWRELADPVLFPSILEEVQAREVALGVVWSRVGKEAVDVRDARFDEGAELSV